MKLNLKDVYLLAMMYKGHRIGDITTHLGYSHSSTTLRLMKIESVLKMKITFHASRINRARQIDMGGVVYLNEAGLAYAKECLKALEILVPNYSEPRVKFRPVPTPRN